MSLRRLKPQVEVIKRAAARFGIPDQTYMKQAAFRQALADLKAFDPPVLSCLPLLLANGCSSPPPLGGGN